MSLTQDNATVNSSTPAVVAPPAKHRGRVKGAPPKAAPPVIATENWKDQVATFYEVANGRFQFSIQTYNASRGLPHPVIETLPISLTDELIDALTSHGSLPEHEKLMFKAGKYFIVRTERADGFDIDLREPRASSGEKTTDAIPGGVGTTLRFRGSEANDVANFLAQLMEDHRNDRSLPVSVEEAKTEAKAENS